MIFKLEGSNVDKMFRFNGGNCACKFFVVLVLDFNFDFVSPGTFTVMAEQWFNRITGFPWGFDFAVVEIGRVPDIILIRELIIRITNRRVSSLGREDTAECTQHGGHAQRCGSCRSRLFTPWFLFFRFVRAIRTPFPSLSSRHFFHLS